MFHNILGPFLFFLTSLTNFHQLEDNTLLLSNHQGSTPSHYESAQEWFLLSEEDDSQSSTALQQVLFGKVFSIPRIFFIGNMCEIYLSTLRYGWMKLNKNKVSFRMVMHCVLILVPSNSVLSLVPHEADRLGMALLWLRPRWPPAPSPTSLSLEKSSWSTTFREPTPIYAQMSNQYFWSQPLPFPWWL